MKRLLVYDLDGTLVDTLEDIAQAANYMLTELEAPPLPAREIRRYVGSGLHELVGRCLKTEDRGLIERGMNIYRAFYTQHLLDHSRLYPGARELLEYFKTRRQAVLTNKPNPYATDILRALGVADYFFVIVGGDSAYPKKPDPSSLRALLELEGIRPEEALLIGDSPIDIETGRHAGIETLTVLHGLSDEPELRAARPDMLVSDFQACLALARRLGW